jgi:hypothetical protein
MLSNWRSPPRRVAKSAEQGSRITGDPGKSVITLGTKQTVRPVREIRTLGAMWRGRETDSRFGYSGSNQLGPTFGTPRQSSTRPACVY